MRKRQRHLTFPFRFRRNNSGLIYLVVVGLVAAVAANVFRKDDGILLLPILVLLAGLIGGMFFRRRGTAVRRHFP